MSFGRYKQDWEELGELDPLWAVLTDPKGKFGRWDLEEFFRTGEKVVQEVLSVAAELGYPRGRSRALDFGCGVGRLTRALAPHFTECCGVDISEQMVGRAREVARNLSNCTFFVNRETRLRRFSDGHFDLILANIVLQHLPSRSLILSYLEEFLRVLTSEGLLVFQLPSFIPLRNRLQMRRRAYGLLRGLGFSHEFLYRSLTLNPIRMNFIPQDRVARFLEGLGAKLLSVRPDSLAGNKIESRTYYVTK